MTRKEYYTMIYEYKKRRREAKKKAKEVLGVYQDHQKVYRNCTKKIGQWQNEIKRIDRRKDKIKKIIQSVNNYFDVDISSRKMDKAHTLARNIYYKLAVESRLQGKLVSNSIGRSNWCASINRLKFQKTFQTKPENKKAFHNFKQYFENK